MRFLILDDHEFYCRDLIEYITLAKQEVYFAKNFREGVEIMEKNPSLVFDVSFIDIILNNGKTGLHFISRYESRLGKIIILTGCIDDNTLETVKKWEVINKADNVLEKLDDIFEEFHVSSPFSLKK
ncbi:MAG: hypothetical protein NZZ41_04660 [Candidatus Dojkabacteria bacterium]|nr:hypothetical protein [Candidatus Dojkabacteria bacterium]